MQRLQPREVAAFEREDRHGVAVQPKVGQVCELAHLRGNDCDAVVVDAQRGERSEPLARLAREARQVVVREPELRQRLHAADAQRKLADRVGREQQRRKARQCAHLHVAAPRVSAPARQRIGFPRDTPPRRGRRRRTAQAAWSMEHGAWSAGRGVHLSRHGPEAEAHELEAVRRRRHAEVVEVPAKTQGAHHLQTCTRRASFLVAHQIWQAFWTQREVG